MWLVIWRTRWRYLGVIPIAFAGLDLYLTTPPDILMNEKGSSIAIRLPTGEISMTGKRLKTFNNEQWQRQTASGDIVKVNDSFTAVEGGYAYIHPMGYKILLLENDPPHNCQGYDIVLSAEPLRGACSDAAYKIDFFDVWRKGSHALWLSPAIIQIKSVQGSQGQRPWSRVAVPRKERKIE